MAWSQTDIDTLKSAIAGGKSLVRYGDRTVQYQSTSDMLRALRVMEAALASTKRVRASRAYRFATMRGD